MRHVIGDASTLHKACLGELTRHLVELVNQLISHAMVQQCAGSLPLQETDLTRAWRAKK